MAFKVRKAWIQEYKQNKEYQRKRYIDETLTLEDSRFLPKASVTITHMMHAENTYKLKLIPAKRYKEWIERFKNQDIIIKSMETKLSNFLKTRPFLSLLHDSKLKFGFMINYIMKPSPYEGNDIYNYSIQQQYEYYSAFYIAPNVKLIRKYIYIRLASYILSLNSYKNKQLYLEEIINECLLIDYFYQSKFMADSVPKDRLNIFIKVLKQLLEIKETDYLEAYNILKETWFPRISIHLKKNMFLKFQHNNI